MEEINLNQEQIDEATAYFNLASLLGRSIQSAAFLITHPDYEPERIVWLDKPAAPPETEEDTDDEEAEPEFDTGTVPAEDADPVIRSGEGSVDDQIEQRLDDLRNEPAYSSGDEYLIAQDVIDDLHHISRLSPISYRPLWHHASRQTHIRRSV